MVLVRVTTSNGQVGWGEAPTTLMTLPIRESVKEVARFYEGRPLDGQHRAFSDFCRYSFYRSRSMEATSALSAVDIACHDLLGKELGAPIHRMLGGALHDSLRAYANGWYPDCIDPSAFAEKARGIVRRGFTALKFDPFGDQYGTLSSPGLAAASARVHAVREAVGPTVDLLIEFHGRFLPAAAVRAGIELDQYHPRFMEEPVQPEYCDALAEFRRTVRTPVALGERLLTPADFESFLRRGLVDVVQPDITNSGGFTSGVAIGGVASAFGAPVAYHNAFGPVQTAATLQLVATLPTFLLQESFETSWPEWKRRLVKGYTLEDGAFQVPSGPGLGITVDERRVEEAQSDAMEPIGPDPPWVIAGTWVRRPATPRHGRSVGKRR
ncbi:MAG: mandelate racemase/muconate lactonizing enzyme family protein [Thermoplasmata archaeon]|nr:mandelate racemase/muconate lactonizing enzyme family protein [Thermoplasmata archaeon]